VTVVGSAMALLIPTTRLGVVALTQDYVICAAGDTLTPDQARILKLMKIKTSLLKVAIRASWLKETGFRMEG
jgi:Insertion domain in 60S ribosomal protein L10P